MRQRRKIMQKIMQSIDINLKIALLILCIVCEKRGSMNSIKDIQHAFYINLESRVDRRLHVEEQMEQIGLNHVASRFNAIKLANGAVGCSLSHLKCLQIALKNKWDHVFICEDDIVFLDPDMFANQFKNCLAKLRNNWDVIMFGGNNLPPYKKVDNSCVQISRCATTTGYLVNGHYVATMIQNIAQGISLFLKNEHLSKMYAIDVYWKSLQSSGKWFLIIPLTVIQKDGYSDIEQKYTNYSMLMQDLNKPHLLNRIAATQQMQTMQYL